MSSVADLEALLQRQPDPKTWAVYADALQAKGDVRGELIALDLELERHGRTPALVKRRNEALFAWLGGTSLGQRRWNPWRFQYGLLDDAGARFTENLNEAWVDALMRSPAASWLSGLRLQSANLGPRQFELLASRPFPWLRRLELDRFWSHRPPSGWTKTLVEHTPHLEALTVGRMREFLAFTLHHPTLRTLTVLDEGLALSNSTLPAVRTARFEGTVRLGDLFRGAPAVERLELLGDWVLFDDDALTRAARERITSVWLDARFDQGGVRLRRVLDAFPNAQVEYAFATGAPVKQARVTVTPPRPWPSREQLVREGRLEATLLVRPTSFDRTWFLSLKDLVLAMEWCFDRLHPDAQAAWRTFWQHLAALREEGVFVLELPTLLTALDGVDDVHFTGVLGFPPNLTNSWGELVEQLTSGVGHTGSLAFGWDRVR